MSVVRFRPRPPRSPEARPLRWALSFLGLPHGAAGAPLWFGRYGAELATPGLQAWVACLGGQDPPPDPALRPEQDGISWDGEQSRKVGLPVVAGFRTSAPRPGASESIGKRRLAAQCTVAFPALPSGTACAAPAEPVHKTDSCQGMELCLNCSNAEDQRHCSCLGLVQQAPQAERRQLMSRASWSLHG